jgi:hypothetical protein
VPHDGLADALAMAEFARRLQAEDRRAGAGPEGVGSQRRSRGGRQNKNGETA